MVERAGAVTDRTKHAELVNRERGISAKRAFEKLTDHAAPLVEQRWLVSHNADANSLRVLTGIS